MQRSGIGELGLGVITHQGRQMCGGCSMQAHIFQGLYGHRQGGGHSSSRNVNISLACTSQCLSQVSVVGRWAYPQSCRCAGHVVMRVMIVSRSRYTKGSEGLFFCISLGLSRSPW